MYAILGHRRLGKNLEIRQMDLPRRFVAPPILLMMASLSSGLVNACYGEEMVSQKRAESSVIHSVCDLSHEFAFYTDGRFYKQYLSGSGNEDSRNWGTLHKCDLSNINLLVLMSGATPCPYTRADIAKVSAFLEEGGGVVVLGNYATFRKQTVYQLNSLAEAFGASFIQETAKKPFKAASGLSVETIEDYGGKLITLQDPSEWTVLVRDAADRALLARRVIGKGALLLGSRSLFGHRPDAKDPINQRWVRPLLQKIVANRKVDPNKPLGGSWGDMEHVVTHGSLRLKHTDYTQGEADAIMAIYDRCMPVMEEILGVPPSKGMMSELMLLPTGGGGFSSGRAIGLGIWWGGFPERQYGMIELIGHEGTHSWVLPFGEPMWNEPIATYIGALLGEKLGYAEEGRGVISRCIAQAKNHDPDMTKFDIAHGKDVARDVMWGKSMWFWEELRREKPDILARYFRVKRRLADPKVLDKYTPDDCVAVIGHAMERDMFPWFQQHGLTVSAENATIENWRN